MFSVHAIFFHRICLSIFLKKLFQVWTFCQENSKYLKVFKSDQKAINITKNLITRSYHNLLSVTIVFIELVHCFVISFCQWFNLTNYFSCNYFQATLSTILRGREKIFAQTELNWTSMENNDYNFAYEFRVGSISDLSNLCYYLFMLLKY